MDNRQRQDLDRYITGNYGEDQFVNDDFPETAHALYSADSGVYLYDPTDDGPECEIITRILARHFTYSPGVEKLVLEWTR